MDDLFYNLMHPCVHPPSRRPPNPSDPPRNTLTSRIRSIWYMYTILYLKQA